jgi:3-hydroxyacyl-[acyl-carrier-protein] dehydratase
VDDKLSQALQLLPHGAEFRFVDRLLSLEPGRRGIAQLRVAPEAPFLRGHFPRQPLFPGVLLIEAGAQLAGIVAQSDPQLTPLPNLKLTAVRSVKITGTAKPGEIIRIEAAVTGRLNNLVQVEVSAAVDGRTVMQGALTLSGDVRS